MARRPITIALIHLGNPKFNLERSCGAEVHRNEILKGKVSVPESARALLRETDEFVKAPRANSEICLRARDLLGSPEPSADSHERQEPKRLWIHGILNLSGTALFTASLISRRRNSRRLGRILAALGYGVMTTAARLGGKMVFEHRVGVDRTAGQTFPTDFVSVLTESELPEAQPKRVKHDGVPILLVRRGTRIFALAETCSHFSGPLSEGKLVEDTIQCPWHRSRFALDDGRVLDGPAVHAQPCLEVRLRDGQIEVRKPLCKTTRPALTAGAAEILQSA